MRTSIFDLFYIGIGPSSSHTIGPMRAAKRFSNDAVTQCGIESIASISIDLYGSLALTGKGHHTDKAILLGLLGKDPETVDTDLVDEYVDQIETSKLLLLLGEKPIPFSIKDNICFKKRERLEHHTNGITFKAFDDNQTILIKETLYSIGGGTVLSEKEISQKLFLDVKLEKTVPFPFKSGADLLQLSLENHKCIADIMFENELVRHSKDTIMTRLHAIWDVMKKAIEKGSKTEGVLPGGLNVKRRAPGLFLALTHNDDAKDGGLKVLDWLSAFAIATNEENAAGGRVVTAPTNGSAGIIPSVLMYYDKFCHPLDDDGLKLFFFSAAAIGFLYKENASLSGAEMGCQGEVGVACSMAAGGLAALMGGSSAQIESAAEIGMEHHLGLTCDPIKGLVQIPCIERNSMGAVKAFNAARLAMKRSDSQKISLDRVIKTMKETGEDMKTKYKETSKGGLALHKVEC